MRTAEQNTSEKMAAGPAARKQRLGVYLHIPFCVRKCAYCDFLSAPASRETREQYVEALKEEIRRAGELGERNRIETVFFGGGTPSLLEGRQTAEILETLSQVMPFAGDTEITVECNPGTLTEEKLGAYRAAGVNRLSIGLQSADNRELLLLGRIHTFEEFLENYELARKKGFRNLNVDLMSALPGQTREGWLRTLEKVTDLEPEHISAYSLIIEEGTEFYDRYQDGDGLPDEEEEREIYHMTKRILEQYGYHRYEISNYCLKGYACRHNLGYWQGSQYLGFGLGASSCVGRPGGRRRRFSNISDMEAYVDESGSPFALRMDNRILPLTEQMEEFMFLGLRCVDGISKREFKEQFLHSYDEIYGNVTESLLSQGLLQDTGERVLLTEFGLDVSNRVMAEFLIDEEH